MKFKSFSLNSDFYKSLTEDLSRAKEKIYLETYIFKDDEIGGHIKKILTEKASQGVKVKLLMDAIGSITVSEVNFTELILAGGDVSFFRRMLLLPFHLTKLNNRNHRKLAIIDSNISYAGSANINQETSYWREFNLRIDDARTNRLLSKIFIEQFLISNTLALDAKKITEIRRTDELTVFRSVPFRQNPIRNFFLQSIEDAKKEIIIENPYVMLDRKILKCFRRALRRGVSIRIILPSTTDVTLAGYLNRKFMRKMKKMGADIYLFSNMLHSKIILIDRESWLFGSANMDYRSMFTQFEIMLGGTDQDIKDMIMRHVDESLANSMVYDEENKKVPWKERIIGNLLYSVKFLF